MSQRFVTSLVFMLFAAASLAGQEQKWTPSRTPDGQPDLQGYWSNTTYTPLERPNNVTKEFFTKEEAAQREKQARFPETATRQTAKSDRIHHPA